jgi:hypothetical protein
MSQGDENCHLAAGFPGRPVTSLRDAPGEVPAASVGATASAGTWCASAAASADPAGRGSQVVAFPADWAGMIGYVEAT